MSKMPTVTLTAKRAAQLEKLATLPEHLRLGVTLPGNGRTMNKTEWCRIANSQLI